MTDPNHGNRRFPEWLEPLRPDDTTRARLRRSILEAAEPLLAARRRGGWFEVAAGWATLLAPTAAGVALLFAALAYRAGGTPGGAESAATAAAYGPEPVAAAADLVVPAVLRADSASGADLVLAATVYAQDGGYEPALPAAGPAGRDGSEDAGRRDDAAGER